MRWWLAVMVGAAFAASGPSGSDCGKRAPQCVDDGCAANQQIIACTAALGSGRLDAIARSLAHFTRGDAHFDLQNYERAVADYDEAVQLNPEFAAAYRNRGEAYLRLGQFDRAVADQTRAVHLDPSDATAYYGRGNAHYLTGENDLAIADYDEAIRIDPSYAFAYNNRGSAYGGKGDFEKAIANYDEAVRLQPKDPLAYNNRAFTLLIAGEYGRAISDYDAAIRLVPYFPVATFNRGRARYHSGDYEGALADFENMLALEPQDSSAVIWAFLARRRLEIPDAADRFDAETKDLDLEQWPGQIVQMFTGEVHPEVVLEIAGESEPEIRNERTCEATFLVGEYLLLAEKQTGAAAAAFTRVTDSCPPQFLEHRAARAELARILSTAQETF
jgi:tetratricopeptide (TPR) repeat protein